MTRSRTKTVDQKQFNSKNLDTLLAATNARGGEQLTRMTGTSGRWPADKIIRSGSLDFDMCTGIGGIPRGRFTEVYGQESSGKTTFFLHVVAEAQRAGLNVIYIDAESALDPNYCKKLGVDLDRMLINQPDSLQTAMDLMTFAMESSMDADSNDLLIVVDSIPALAPIEVMQSSAEQQTRAMAARYWSAQLPKLTQLARKSRSTVLLVNQMRDSLDMYTPATTPGGKAIKFACSLRIALKRDVEGKRNAGGSDGQTGNFDIVKNKVGSPFKKGSFWLPKGEPVIWEKDVVDACIEWSRIVDVDQKFEDGELVSKKNWYTIQLRPGWLDLMRQDELADWLADNDIPDEDGNMLSGDELHTEDNFDFSYSDEATTIAQYQYKKFLDEVSNYPSLIEAMEEALLDTLNEGDVIDDVEGSALDYAEKHEGEIGD